MNIEMILFYFFSIVSLISGAFVISSTNPIHSVLFLILVFCNATGLLVLLEVEFLAMIFLMVYVGAIAVLFLFVVMMLNVRIIEFNISMLRYLPIGGLIALIFLLEIFLIVDSDLIPLFSHVDSAFEFIQWNQKIDTLTNIETLGELMYTYYFYLFLVAGLILLVAMIGAIVLTMHKRTNVKRQDIFDQVTRDFEKAIILKKHNISA